MLNGISAAAPVWYYSCPACGHVWIVRKDDPNGEQAPVTVRQAIASAMQKHQSS